MKLLSTDDPRDDDHERSDESFLELFAEDRLATVSERPHGLLRQKYSTDFEIIDVTKVFRRKDRDES